MSNRNLRQPVAPVEDCYLCGKAVGTSDFDDDHVPPRRFYSRAVRREARIQLLRLRVHRTCNRSYQVDEDYFFSVLVPVAASLGDGAAQDSLADLRRSMLRPEGRRLLASAGFPEELAVDRAAGVGAATPAVWPTLDRRSILQIFSQLDRSRLHRVVWKLIRGLRALRGEILEECAEHHTELRLVSEQPELADRPWDHLHGDYSGSFEFCVQDETEPSSRTQWLKLWGQIVATVTYSG